MHKKIRELRDFYLLDNKLLYISKKFIGYDPLISKGLSFEKTKNGKDIKHDTFEMDGVVFNATLTNFISFGPLRGYRRVEISRNDKTIINYECGGMGHGLNYSKGNYFHIENKEAFLVKYGHAMREWVTGKIYSDLSEDHYYFLWFKDIIIQ